MIRKILLLGDPRLYTVCAGVQKDELSAMDAVVRDMDDTLMDYRRTYGAGRAVAAPQIGVFKRLVLVHIDKPVPLFNPVLTFADDETREIRDDCMSFPGLYVRVLRRVRCRLTYRDEKWNERTRLLEGDLSELLQHETDHLDGILATMRAIDDRSFSMVPVQ